MYFGGWELNVWFATSVKIDFDAIELDKNEKKPNRF